MSKQPPYGLVVPRPVFEIDRRRSMSELVNGDPKSHRLLNALSDLQLNVFATFGLTALAREQPGGIRSAKQRRPELMNVFVDEVGQGLIELEVQIDTVLYVIVRENEPVRRSSAHPA